MALVAFPAGAQAYKVRGHFYSANQAISKIMAGQNAVTLRDGRTFAVDARLAGALRSYPEYYRGGVGGADFLPDLPMAQASMHPVSTPWIPHVYNRGWQAYNNCGGCAAGKQALAYAYGFITHVAGDVWAHTFVNRYADGVFPDLPDVFANSEKRRHAVRHLVVEGYLDRHTPKTDTTMEAPLDFIRSTFIENPPAGASRGPLLNYFKSLQTKLNNDRSSLKTWIDGKKSTRSAKQTDLTTQNMTTVCTFLGCASVPDITDAPANVIEAGVLSAEILAITAELVVPELKLAYLDAWRADVNQGLYDYPADHLKIGKAIFAHSVNGEPAVDLVAAQTAAQQWVTRGNGGMLSMLGVPDFVGGTIGGIIGFTAWVEGILGEIAKPITAAKDAMVDYILKKTLGMTKEELKTYLTAPETWINSPLEPVKLPSNTSALIDTAMQLGVNGVTNPTHKFDPSKFGVMNNTIELAKLVLLDQQGLNQLVGGSFPHPNVMLGWPKSMDGEYQWLGQSPRDGGSYGQGNFYLWKNCTARRDVFHKLFFWWGDNSGLPTGWSRDRGFPVPPGEACSYPPPTNLRAPSISGQPAVGQALTCSRGLWFGATSYTYAWRRSGAPIAGATGSTYTVVAADAGKALTCTVTATNANGPRAVTSAPVSVPAAPGPTPGPGPGPTPGPGPGPTPTNPTTAPANIKRPAISGRARLGRKVKCARGTWSGSPKTYRYAWVRGRKAIRGARRSTYRITRADVKARKLACRVTAVNAVGARSATSKAVRPRR